MGVRATNSVFSSEWFGAVLSGWFVGVIPYLAAIEAIFAFFSKYLGDIIAAQAKSRPGRLASIKNVSAKAALWFAAVVIPSLLWLLYLE